MAISFAPSVAPSRESAYGKAESVMDVIAGATADFLKNNAMKEKQAKMLEKAVALAVKAHAGQRDKSGEPYVFHPLRMMLRCQSFEEKLVSVLHDVVED